MSGRDRPALVDAIAEALHGRQLATAESCTGGRLAAALTDGPAASSWFRGGIVPYQEDLKRSLLGVTAASVYSEDAVREMALGAAQHFGADAAVATSGVSGDEPVDGVEPGTVFIATTLDGDVQARTYHFVGSSPVVCDAASDAALRQLLARLMAAGRG